MTEYGYRLGGEERKDGEPLVVRSCWDGREIGVTFRPPPAALAEAVSLATASAPAMAKLPSHARAEVLRRMADSVSRRAAEFVRMLALEAGKPVKAGRVEVDRCVFNLRHAAEEAQRIESELIPLDLLPWGEKRWGLVRRFPVGPVLAITPFNFPLNLVTHKLAPAFASGNTVVQKPASKTPLCSLLLGRIAAECGLLEGALSVVPCSAAAAEELVADPRFGLLTFTGSAAVGWSLREKAGRKRVALELGGNAGVIVHDDADIEEAAFRCAAGGFSYAGQSCISVQRIFVQSRVFSRFRDALVDRVRALVVGDPMDEGTDVGPMISPDEVRRVAAWVEEARQQGAQVLAGGAPGDGQIYLPTVLTGSRPTMRVNCEEIFGPVVTVEPYDSFQEALEAVNRSRYGLQAGVFTCDIRKIFQAFEVLEVGGVVANDVPTYRADHMPYGGVKDSGVGREGIRYAIEEMTERRILVLNLH
jgi:glyceraldehyde-3-phosphate dehydrogenase (NADP+)